MAPTIHCFAISSTSFINRTINKQTTCPTYTKRRVAIHRLRATATDADAEKQKDIQSDQIDDFEEQVPGKIQLDEISLARQKSVLESYAKELRKKRLEEEREAARLFGWVPYAETLNGRLAMFFILTGLLTEYWTGYTIPEQVELMLRTLGVI